MRNTILGLALVLTLASACSSGGTSSGGTGAWGGSGMGAPEPEPDIMRRDDICYEDVCESCQSACGECLDTCFSAMTSGVDIDCGSACSYSCDGDCSSECSGEPLCMESAPGFALPENADPKVLAACERAVARDQSCGELSVAAACDHYARVERPEAAGYYDCFAGVPCGAPTEDCSPPPGTLGDEICAQFETSCETACNDEGRAGLNQASAWLRDDVIDAVRTCFDTSCSSLVDCIDAWLATVFPEE